MTLALAERRAVTPRIKMLPPTHIPTPTATDEINHRIANSLQMLCAMVSSEARTIADPAAREALESTRRRIGAIASVHRLLYHNHGTAAVDLKAYLETLGDSLTQGAEDRVAGVQILVRADAVVAPIEVATSIGIIVSELVTNACKYAFAPGVAGLVTIRLRDVLPNALLLEVEDRGRGRDPHAGPQGTGFGGRLIEMMAARLGGQCAWHDAQPGTRFSLYIG